MGQDALDGQGIDFLEEPFVAGGGFDDGGEFSEGLKPGLDRQFVSAEEPPALEDLSGLVDDAGGDSLFVEVDADEIHGDDPFVEAGSSFSEQHVYHASSTSPTRLDLLSHSFHPTRAAMSSAGAGRSRSPRPS